MGTESRRRSSMPTPAWGLTVEFGFHPRGDVRVPASVGVLTVPGAPVSAALVAVVDALTTATVPVGTVELVGTGRQRLRRLPRSTTTGEHEVDHRPREDQHRRPDVDPQTEDVVGLVRAHELDPEPACRVTRDVQGERATVTESELAVGLDDHPGATEVPQQFVEERRVHH